MAALLTRLRQLRCQQLCRLPLLLHRVGQPGSREPQPGLVPQWQLDLVHHTRRQLPCCDVVDVVLLLRGLAAGCAAATTPRQNDTSALDGMAAACSLPLLYEMLRTELAHDALRRYTVRGGRVCVKGASPHT